MSRLSLPPFDARGSDSRPRSPSLNFLQAPFRQCYKPSVDVVNVEREEDEQSRPTSCCCCYSRVIVGRCVEATYLQPTFQPRPESACIDPHVSGRERPSRCKTRPGTLMAQSATPEALRSMANA